MKKSLTWRHGHKSEGTVFIALVQTETADGFEIEKHSTLLLLPMLTYQNRVVAKNALFIHSILHTGTHTHIDKGTHTHKSWPHMDL